MVRTPKMPFLCSSPLVFQGHSLWQHTSRLGRQHANDSHACWPAPAPWRHASRQLSSAGENGRVPLPLQAGSLCRRRTRGAGRAGCWMRSAGGRPCGLRARLECPLTICCAALWRASQGSSCRQGLLARVSECSDGVWSEFWFLIPVTYRRCPASTGSAAHRESDSVWPACECQHLTMCAGPADTARGGTEGGRGWCCARQGPGLPVGVVPPAGRQTRRCASHPAAPGCVMTPCPSCWAHAACSLIGMRGGCLQGCGMLDASLCSTAVSTEEAALALGCDRGWTPRRGVAPGAGHGAGDTVPGQPARQGRPAA